MQIIIVQTEIEEAIRNHILNQVSINEGMAIDIDLKATRGSEGFQAFINIHPADQAPPSTAAESEPAIEPEKPLQIEKTVEAAKSTGRRGRSKPAEPAPAVANDPVSQEPEGNTTDEPTETASEPASGSAEEPQANAETESKPMASIFAQKKTDEQPAGEEAPAGERQSLFGGLKRPVNA